MSTNAEQEEGGRLYWSERKAVARCMRRLYRRGLTTSTGGNVSCRVGSDLVAISAAGVDKANVRARDVALLRLDGENLKSKMIMQVHDELVLEVPETELEKVKTRLPQLMAGVARLLVPLKAEVGYGSDWEAAH